MKKNSYVAHESNGIWYQDIKMNNMSRLPDHEYSQCGFRYEDGYICYYSYSSCIFMIPLDSLHYSDVNRTDVTVHYTSVAPNYSRSTINHVRWFTQFLETNLAVRYTSIRDWFHEGRASFECTVSTEALQAILSNYDRG